MAFPSKPITQLHGSNGPVHALAYSSSPSTYIVTGSADRSIRLYNPSRPSSSTTTTSTSTSISKSLQPPQPTQLIQTYSAHGYAILDLSISTDNATFASCGGDRAVFLWDVRTAATLRRFGGSNGHTARVNAVTFAGEGENLLVSGSFDASVRIWDVRNHAGGNNAKPVMVLDEARDSVSVVWAWREGMGRSGEGMEFEILAGSVDGRVRGYDVRMGKMTTDVVGASVTSLQRTRDGKGLLVGTLDSTIRLMDHDSGGLLKAYKATNFTNEEFRIRSCFGGNERWVLSGNEDVKGDDGQVVVWDTLTGEIVHKIRVEASRVEQKKRVGADGKEKERKNVVSCVAWKENGKGDQWCCAGTDGVVTVFG